MSADFGPCASWDAIYPCDISGEPVTGVALATSVATTIVDALSGRQFGPCPVTIRPCLRECLSTPFNAGWSAWPGVEESFGTSWFAFVTCNGGCGDACSCGNLSEVILPSPVNSITEVKVDGSPLVTGSYKLYNSRNLVRTDGLTWPRCNDLTKDDTETGTWSVTLTVGQPVPDAGRLAVGELACQVLRALNGEECRLPRSVTRLVRQGVTIEFPDIISLFDKGLTGLYLTDFFIQSVNPGRLKQRSRVYSVDGTLARRPS